MTVMYDPDAAPWREAYLQRLRERETQEEQDA
jgi:hypothetical protein